MASPDINDGFTRIANELFEEVLLYPFSKRELKIMLAVIRKTYGFNKKSDDIGCSQITDMTGIRRNHVGETIDNLARMNVLIKQEGVYANNIGINKDYSTWGSPKTGHVPKQDESQNRTEGSPKTGQKVVPKQDPQKTIPKDNTKRQKIVLPNCPHEEIINCYHETLPELQRVLIKLWGGPRKKNLAACWKKDAKHQSIEFWGWFFEAVRMNPHWMGNNERGWKASLGWLVKPENFIKVLEEGADQEQRTSV